MGFIDKAGLDVIKNYKYVSGTYTYLDVAMQPFWNNFALLVPFKVAPNLVTLTGLFMVFAATLSLCYQDTSTTLKLDPAYHYLCAFCLFMYQTLDAVDGKHARRTSQSSPLGQLFDHGCDAMVVLLLAYVLVQLWQAGPGIEMFLICGISTSNFYTGQVEEYYSHVMTTNFLGLMGVTELQTTAYTIIAINAMTGLQFNTITLAECFPSWFLESTVKGALLFHPDAQELIYNATLFRFFVVLVVSCAFVTTVVHTVSILSHTKETPRIKSLVSFFPVLQFHAVFFAIFMYTDYAWENAGVIILGLLPLYSLLTQRQIICCMTQQKLNPVQLEPFLFLILPANKFLHLGVPETCLLLTLFLITTLCFFHFVVGAIQQITEHLQINCLTYTPPKATTTKKKN